jgi:hypothetical protein
MKTPMQTINEWLQSQKQYSVVGHEEVQKMVDALIRKERALLIEVYNQGHEDREKGIFNLSRFLK